MEAENAKIALVFVILSLFKLLVSKNFLPDLTAFVGVVYFFHQLDAAGENWMKDSM